MLSVELLSGAKLAQAVTARESAGRPKAAGMHEFEIDAARLSIYSCQRFASRPSARATNWSANCPSRASCCAVRCWNAQSDTPKDCQKCARGEGHRVNLRAQAQRPPKTKSGETDIDGRISKLVMHGTRVSLRGRQHHSDQATEGLHGLEELGDEARQAERDEESQGALARKLAVIMHRMLADGRSFRNVAAA